MKRSTNRILTTHTGSLVRPPQLLAFVRARQMGQAIDERAFDATLHDAVGDVVVRRQVGAGIDVPNDGEFGKSTSWSLYALKRLSGFEIRGTPKFGLRTTSSYEPRSSSWLPLQLRTVM